LADRANIGGGQEFALGVATLEAYLLLDYQTEAWGRGSFMKDMLDVLRELPASTIEELLAAGKELWRLHSLGESDKRPDYEQLRSQAGAVIGELATLRDCRIALRELIAKVNQGIRDDAVLRPLAESASGNSFVDGILESVIGGTGPVELVEIDSDKDACPRCFVMFPVAMQNRLKKSTNVFRCGSCGVLLVRSLEK
jgi:hypothetical protein